MLETLRQYARERLERRRRPRPLATSARRALRRDTPSGSVRSLVSPDEIAARRVLMADLDDLRAAVTWALDRDDADDIEFGLRMITALVIESSLRVKNGIGMWALRAVAAARSARVRTRGRRSNTAMAWIEFHRGDFAAAVVHAEARRRRARPCADRRGGLGLLGARHRTDAERPGRGRPRPRARRRRAVRGRRRSRGPAARIDAPGQRCDQPRDVRRHQHARGYAEAALVVAREMRSPTAIALAQSAARAVLLYDDPEAAALALQEAIALGEAGSMDAILVPALMFLAMARLAPTRPGGHGAARAGTPPRYATVGST